MAFSENFCELSDGPTPGWGKQSSWEISGLCYCPQQHQQLLLSLEASDCARKMQSSACVWGAQDMMSSTCAQCIQYLDTCSSGSLVMILWMSEWADELMKRCVRGCTRKEMDELVHFRDVLWVRTPLVPQRIFQSSSSPSYFLHESLWSSPRHSGTPEGPQWKPSTMCECVGSVFETLFPNHLAFGQMTQLRCSM